MKNKILLFTFSLMSLYSCSTAYKSGQTPDDVYYSPARYVDDEDEKEEKSDSAIVENTEDRQIRMKSRDRRWRELDGEYGYNGNYHPYNYGYSYPYYYNPYYFPYPVHIGTYTANTPPVRTINLNTYNNTPVTIRNPKTGTISTVRPSRNYNIRNAGSVIREVITSTGSGGGRTYTPSSSSGSGNSRGSGTPVTRPVRTSN